MNTDPALDRKQILALTIIELRPMSMADALSAWRYGDTRYTAGMGREGFESAVGALLSRGLIRFQEDGNLTITVAGRAALSWH